VKAKLDVKAHAFSEAAQKAIEAAGGAIVKL
ncbi:MAG: uL15m family ribosomal protein, partial [Daejeonella sp.]